MIQLWTSIALVTLMLVTALNVMEAATCWRRRQRTADVPNAEGKAEATAEPDACCLNGCNAPAHIVLCVFHETLMTRHAVQEVTTLTGNGDLDSASKLMQAVLCDLDAYVQRADRN